MIKLRLCIPLVKEFPDIVHLLTYICCCLQACWELWLNTGGRESNVFGGYRFGCPIICDDRLGPFVVSFTLLLQEALGFRRTVQCIFRCGTLALGMVSDRNDPPSEVHLLTYALWGFVALPEDWLEGLRLRRQWCEGCQ